MSIELAQTNSIFWSARLDELKQSRNTNDNGIGVLLEVSRQCVCQWRGGKEIPGLRKLRILELLNYDKNRDAFFGLMPDKIGDSLRVADGKANSFCTKFVAEMNPVRMD